MRSETEIKDRKTQIIEEMKTKKLDMETTEIYGQLKKDNPLLKYDWMKYARERLSEIYILSWALDENVTVDIFNLMDIK